MTEKRFKYIDNGELEYITSPTFMSNDLEEICNELNALHEEIIELREAMKKVDHTKHTDNKDVIIKRIIKCYLTFEKEATARTILKHIENTGYGLRGLTGPAQLTKQIKKWKHDDKYLHNIKWYIDGERVTVFYLDKK